MLYKAQSNDLMHWTKCGPVQEFVQDERCYEPKGRWDCIWTIPRPGGGQPKNSEGYRGCCCAVCHLERPKQQPHEVHAEIPPLRKLQFESL